MIPSQPFEVLIAGAGPAGLATALNLIRMRPKLRGRVGVIDKSAHPRNKVCAGGLIPRAMAALDELGIALEVPSFTVMRGSARTSVGEVDLTRGDTLATVIRRSEFDAMIARHARSAGVELIENCRVLDVSQSADSVSVKTARGDFESRIAVGADGSGSRVRRAVFGRDKDNIGRAIMFDIAVDGGASREFRDSRYAFDFRCVAAGIAGYAWTFPCFIGGRPHLNVGIYDQRPRDDRGASGEQALMVEQLDASFPEFRRAGGAQRHLRHQAFPIRWFDERDEYANGRVILAGDAAGVDPLMGEGISTAFEHGKSAARACIRFLDGDAGALAAYDRELHRGPAGHRLAVLARAARKFYGRHSRNYFRIAHLSRRAQELGLDWFNGSGEIDDLHVRSLAARWIGAVLFGTSVR